MARSELDLYGAAGCVEDVGSACFWNLSDCAEDTKAGAAGDAGVAEVTVGGTYG